MIFIEKFAFKIYKSPFFRTKVVIKKTYASLSENKQNRDLPTDIREIAVKHGSSLFRLGISRFFPITRIVNTFF